MSLVKLSATVLTFVLILQSGCDFFCQHAEEAANASEHQSAQTPPCHDTSDGEKSEHKQHSGNHGSPKDCIHPQATDDGSKLLGKIAKENLPAVITGVHGIDGRFQLLQPLTFATPGAIGFNPASPPSSILRI